MTKLILHLVALALYILPPAALAGKPVLRVGTEGLYPPYNFCGTVAAPKACASPNDLIGFDIDIAKAICDQINYECKFVLNDWDSLLINLKKGKYDVALAAIGYRPERTRFGRYTITYENIDAQPGVYFYTTKGKLPRLTLTPEGMGGKTISTQTGTLHEDYLKKTYTQSNIETYSTLEEASQALVNGSADACLANADAMASFLARNPDVVNINTVPISYDENGFNVDNIYGLVRKNTSDRLLYDKINNAILKLQLSGYIRERHKFWVP